MMNKDIIEAMQNLESKLELGNEIKPTKSQTYFFDGGNQEDEYNLFRKYITTMIEDKIQVDLNHYITRYEGVNSDYRVKDYSEIIHLKGEPMWFNVSKHQVFHSDKLLIELINESFNVSGYDDHTSIIAGKLVLNTFGDEFVWMINKLDNYLEIKNWGEKKG